MATETYQLFKYDACPFCARVRHFLDQAGIQIEMRDILQDRSAFEALVQGGGSQQVPCLRIESTSDNGSVSWLYESADIVAYLQQAYAK